MRHGDKMMTDTQKEAILQLVALGRTKKDIAETIGVDQSTVYRFLRKQQPDELKEARREAMERVAQKVTKHVEESLDKLDVPEEATYLQRMTGIGIGVDKIAVLDKRLQEHDDRDKTPAAGALLPTSIEALVGAIRNDIKSFDFSILRVHLDKEDAALVEGLSLDTPFPRAVEAEVMRLEDFDDVGGSGGA